MRNSAKRTALAVLTTAVVAGIGSIAQADLVWDPGLTNGAAPGGTAAWWSGPNFYDGASDTWYNDASVVVFKGTAGTVTLNDTQINVTNGMSFQSTGYTVAFNGKALNVPGGIEVQPGVIATFNGSVGGSPGWGDVWGGGTLILGDGSALASPFASATGVRLNLILNNSPTGGAGAINYLNIKDGGTVAGTGSAGVWGVDLVGATGSIRPGNALGAIGALKLLAGANLNAGTVAIDIASASSYDVLKVSDTATLGGSTLSVNLVGGYAPAYGDSFDVIQAGSISGTNLAYSLPTLGDGLSWDKSIVGGNVHLSVVPEPAAIGLAGLALLGLVSRRRRA